MSGVITTPQRAEIAAWLAADPDDETHAELTSLLDTDPAEVERRFADRLTFGTAGLRGPLGAGPNRMNRVIVRMAAWAVGTRLLRDNDGGLVVIGYDARHNSREFAIDTARVLGALGLDVEVSDDVVPTPVLAHGVLDRNAIAGVMVTASHNPPGDNGYKVYWSDGAQIIPPIDRDIEALIASRGPLAASELGPVEDVTTVSATERIDRYIEDVIGSLTPHSSPGSSGSGPTKAVSPVTVYTPMHGVGGATLFGAFDRAELPRPEVVQEQFTPDGRFPTVDLPNPEEDGALDLAYETAERVGADLILANDPDADRLGVAVRHDGDWRELSGDEIGTLLADHLLSQPSLSQPSPTGAATPDRPDRVVACSIVSSTAIDRVARHHGVQLRRTLTGFKWIIRPAIDERHLEFVFGYEEALGFAPSDRVRDKDGVSAAVVIARLAAELRSADHDLIDRIDEIARRDGLVVTRPVSVRYDADPAAVPALMERIRHAPPPDLGGRAVQNVTDWREASTPADIVELDLGTSGRVLIRPSGTEPKIKAYIEATLDEVTDVDDARARLDADLTGIAAAIRTLLSVQT